MATYQLVRPIRDNKEAFKRLYPGAYYAGDIGDAGHADGPSEHNAQWHEDSRNTKGWVYAQDFGQGGTFDLPTFARWLLDQLRAGRYPEVKYIITRHVFNAGTGYFGLFDARYGWRQQSSFGHTTHIHVSYGPYTLHTPSTIIADYHAWQTGTTNQQEDDDMGATWPPQEIPLQGVGGGPIGLVEAGAADPRSAWVNITNDTFGEQYALRIFATKGEGKYRPVAEKLVLSSGQRWAVQLEKGDAELSILRVPVEDEGAVYDGPLRWTLERGAVIK